MVKGIMNQNKGRTHLCIPDPHAHPDYNNERFTAVGNLIVALQPEVVVCLGDMADMPSLCSYEKGTGKFEGRRYKADIQANIDANEKLWTPLKEYNARKKANKEKQYKPYKVFLNGNHEHRITRAVNQDPILEGTIQIDDLQNHKYWDSIYSFLSVANIDGIHYSHYFTSGVLGRPISGEHQAYTMLTKQHVSCTQGHTHTRDYCERTTATGKRIQAVVGGCMVDYPSDWAGPAANMWWSGVIIKHNVIDGEYDLEFMSLDHIKNNYGVK